MSVVSARVLFLVFFVILLFNLVRNVQSKSVTDCSLSLSKDFSTPGPVLIRNHDYLAPNTQEGNITLKRSDSIIVACPGRQRKIMLGNETMVYDVLEAHCIINSTFRVERRIAQFKDIRCNSQPWYVARETYRLCHGRSNYIYEVGYEVKTTFYPLYEACFNKYLLHTYYVKHNLTPMSAFMQTGVNRPNFLEGNLFGKVKMNELYKVNAQKTRLDIILGYNMASQFITNKQFLTRGHLAARADYTTSAQTRATFHYINTAPQWMRGNAGDWAALEDALRRHVQTKGVNVTVYTGTHGVMILPNVQGQMKEVYLHVDENNNPQVPVPMYYYKLVYDPSARTAVAFISINSSFYNDTITNSLVFCDDICARNKNYSWLKWRSNDGTFSFCCDYDSFTYEVDYLPKLDVKGRFY